MTGKWGWLALQVWLGMEVRIPAFAGMTGGLAGMTRCSGDDGRVSGDDEV